MAEENNNNEENITVPNVDLTGPEGYKGIFDIDKTLGLGAAAIQARSMDNTAIEEYIGAIETPASGSALDKVAALYRSQGEGAVLRMQRNVRNLIGPTVNLIKEREAAFKARFAVLQESLPDISNSVVFGDDRGTPMPITDDIVSRANQVREDMRLLAALNPTDERYASLQKKIEKNQDVVVNFDVVNKQLLEIRNGEQVLESDFGKDMTEEEKNMWYDIYNERGENIKIDEDGRLIWQDPNNLDAPPIYLDKIAKKPKEKRGVPQDIDTLVRGEAIAFRDALEKNTAGSAANSIGGARYNTKMLPLYAKLTALEPDQINSLVWNGLGGNELYDGIPTDSFVSSLIENQIIYNPEFREKYGGDDGEVDTESLTTEEMATIINDMKRGGPIKEYYDAEGNLVSMKTQFLKWYKNTVDGIITDASYTAPVSTEQRVVTTPPIINEGEDILDFDGGSDPSNFNVIPSSDPNRDMLALNNVDQTSNTLGQGDPIVASILEDQGIDVNMYDALGNFKGAPTDDPNLTASTDGVVGFDDLTAPFKAAKNYIDSGQNLQFPNSDFHNDDTFSFSRNLMASIIGRDLAAEYIGKDGQLFRAEKMDFIINKKGQILQTTDGVNWTKSPFNNNNAAFNLVLKHLATNINTTTGEPYLKNPPYKEILPVSSFDDYASNFNKISSGDSKTANIKINPMSISLSNEKRVAARNIRITFENGQPFMQPFPDNEEYDKLSPKQPISDLEAIKLYKSFFPKAKEKDIKAFVNEQMKNSKEVKEEDKKETTNNKVSEDLDKRLNNLTVANTTVGGSKLNMGLLFSYDDETFVINALNREFKKDGFRFAYSTRYRGNFTIGDQDALVVYHTNDPKTAIFLRFDSSGTDKSNTQKMIKIMRLMYENKYEGRDDVLGLAMDLGVDYTNNYSGFEQVKY
tara:strand:+ start:4945 stop:7698 length:2754 start_codon:yes stop_codon:yes gene_type:complete